MSTRMQGKFTTGPGPSPDITGEGAFLCRQTQLINRDATLVQNATFNIPVGSAIHAIHADVLTAYDSATSATLSVGNATGDTSYASGINVKTGGRTVAVMSAAQAAAINSLTSSTVVATVTSVGQPAVGSVRVVITYEPAAN